MKQFYKKNPVHIPDPITEIRAYISGLINQSNYRISQDGLVLWCWRSVIIGGRNREKHRPVANH
jgi:hypothetical protein